jgi:hypothetical protein
MKRTIGSLKQEIHQPSNYLMNIAYEGIRHSWINTLLAARPELDDTLKTFPTTSINLGDEFALLHKRDKDVIMLRATDPSHQAILQFLQSGPGDDPPKLKRWAHTSLPNGQIT